MDIQDIPQTISVVSREFLEDTMALRMLDAAKYVTPIVENTLPTTPILTWARPTGVAMDKLSATEEREGGTLAPGQAVPGFARESLSVFSPAEWEKNKSTLTFAVWTERARLAAATAK